MSRFFRLPVILSVVFIFGWGPGAVIADAAEEKLTFGADIRLRYEFLNNFNQLYYGDEPGRGAGNDGFLLGRLRFGFDYRPSSKVHLAFWMQHSDAWDNSLADGAFYNKKFDLEHNPNKDRWELWDSYLEIKEVLDLPLAIKGGRQRIFYADNRVFGPGEWGNSGRWIWDAVKLSWNFKGGFVDAYYGRTQLHEPNEFSLNHRHGFESAGVYSHFTLPEKFFKITLEPFFMTKKDNHNRYKGEDLRMGYLDSYYCGLKACGKDIKGVDYDFTFITQNGDSAHDDIKAYGYHLLVAYNFKEINLKPVISVEYSFASGDSNPHDGDHETFDGAFGARDKMYGRMNFFYWQNIKDAQINLEIRPREWIYIKAEFHKFRLAEREDAWYLNAGQYRDKSGISGDEVGRELDILATIDLSPKNQIQVGLGRFWPDEFAKKQASHKQSDWAFCQWTHKFSGTTF